MFVAEALFPFSQIILQPNNSQSKQQEEQQKNQPLIYQNQKISNELIKKVQNDGLQQRGQVNTRNRSASQQKQLSQIANQSQNRKKVHCQQKMQQNSQKQEKDKIQKQPQQSIKYLSFQAGQKILVKQAYQNGWWYGNTIKNPQIYGFFPSNYVKIGSKPPPPPKQQNQLSQSQQEAYNPYQDGAVDWVSNQLKKVQKGPIESAYYLGIKGYKNVKIDDKNQNILKGDHVKFDVNTGLARVPIKNQAPTAKAVRQMGYYFDYHQWCEERNKAPDSRARPDASKKKKKKLNLKFMN